MLWWGRAASLCALALAVTAGIRSTPVEARQLAAPAVPVEIAPSLEPHRDRVAAAARESLARYQGWLGPYPFDSLTIDAARRPAAIVHSAGRITIDPPWWSSPALMTIESQVAYGVARQWWLTVGDETADVPLPDAIAWYLQSRVVERLFDTRYRMTAHSVEGVRYFGGMVPWALPSLPLSRWTAGLGRAAFLGASAQVSARPMAGRRLPAGVDQDTARGALVFGTLERHLGWPVLQGALRAVAARAVAERMTSADVFAGLSAAVGQDLSWFLEPAFDPDVRFDYAVQELSTGLAAAPCGTDPCYETRVIVTRRGDARFTGTARQPVGEYDTGDALELRVAFADGQQVTARWDGRSVSRAFDFESPAPAVHATLDPDRVLLLDASYADNTRLVSPASNVPTAKWIARWLIWLQDAMLTYAALA